LIVDWTIRLGWILVAWLFALGGVVGSFLNVVVYRLPRGKSIVHPGSACPACGHPIRWYHNLPIVSWIVLGGRCHDCRARISVRYPLVELAVAALFAGLFLIDARPRIMAIAAASPGGTTPTDRDVLVHYASDLWLLSTLFCAALIEWDAMRVPRRIFLIATAVALIGAVACPDSRYDSAATAIPLLAVSPRAHAIAEFAAGVLAGGAIGILNGLMFGWLVASRGQRHSNVSNSALVPLVCIGAFLGWFAAVAVGIVAAIEMLIARKFPGESATPVRFGWSAAALIAALVWIVSP
jgi:leader peptidase (prepilin peptidase) / N-methyltransferase